MPNVLELMYSLNGSYSGVFVLFWGSMVLTWVGLRILESSKNKTVAKVESGLFWLFGATMVAFAAFRPIGIARDDLNYLEIYNTICPTLSCGQWVQGGRDRGWYLLVGLLKSLVPDPRVMLWLGAVGLLLKLGVIFSLSRRPLLVLLLYMSIYYEVQDLTTFRASLAIAVFMAGFWLVTRFRTYRYFWVLFASGLFHKQAYVAPMILVGAFLKHYRWLLVLVCVVPILLTLFSIYPDFQTLLSAMTPRFQAVAVNKGLDGYIAAKNAGAYQGWRTAPIVVYPQLILILWLLLKGDLSNAWLESLLTGCLVMGCLFLWAFVSLPDAQVRFFEFFMVPTVLLAGMRRLDAFEAVGVVAVSGVFLMKYNVLNHLIV